MPGHFRKQKGPNPVKLAAGEMRVAEAVEGLCSGKFEIGRVSSIYGDQSFEIELSRSSKRDVSLYGKLFKAGQKSRFYVRRGDWLIVCGAEVQAPVTASMPEVFREIRRAGRLPDLAEVSGLAEFFDVEQTAEEAEAAALAAAELEGAKSLREAEQMRDRLRQAREHLGRIRARRAGLIAKAAKAREDAELAGPADAEEAPPAAEAEEEPLEASGAAAPAAAEGGPARREANPHSRRSRARAAALAMSAEEAALAAEEAAAAERVAALYAAAEREAAEDASLDAELVALSAQMVAAGDWEAFVDAI